MKKPPIDRIPYTLYLEHDQRQRMKRQFSFAWQEYFRQQIDKQLRRLEADIR